MCPQMVVALHEILNEDLPIERAVPLLCDNDLHVAQVPTAQVAIEFRVLLSHRGGIT